ncbi:MAG: winged helix-turn-helix domain-containing protein [Leclercia adecarboxylata]|uniref:winged helix-turn-helix domain-containing protein n=1 Tax=Leclercia adecarboxylata TaxID=83655 RepID=UPI00254ED71A|nr:winged helix-turn-helix domain-containing protein [Leclercia adecarboxylata]MDK4745254.1 winged helix-turn-helix domain-containing protein [Leclercia adecarboxylata]MDU1059267.1 winged helix-turn-helix domain-containing protein [Leclercia adecarboxylata]
MKPVFLINETVLFEPEARRLCSLTDYPARAVILHGPVSECLLQLLEQNEQVLTQRYLFAAVWEKQGTVVTTNALYQTIASIRKALKSAGLEENVIITVPKAGFKSVARLRVGTQAEFIERNKTITNPDLAEVSSEVVKPDILPPVTQRSRRFWRPAMGYWLAGALFLLSCGVLYPELKPAEPVFVGYHPIGTIDGCEAYSSWNETEKSQRMWASLSQRFPLTCKKGEVAYMTLNRAQLGISVIICDRAPENREARCESIFYRQPYYDNE